MNNIFDKDWIEVDGNMIHRTAIIYPNTTMGKNNYIGPYTVIGGNGEIRGVDQYSFSGTVQIGDNNVISEHVTIQAPFESGRVTRIGSNNIIMAKAHVGHDAEIGDGCEVCTSSIIGGYAKVKDGAKIKLNCTVRNRITVGKSSVVGMASVVTKDVNEGAVVYGNPAKEHPVK